MKYLGGNEMVLEYRLDDGRNYPALWYYNHLNMIELVARMTCEYFIKDNKTYTVTGTRKEPGVTVIYLKEDFTSNEFEKHYSHIGFELKEVLAAGRYHTIESRELFTHDEALELFHCDVIIVNDREFHLDSRELDEDRKCYVYYGHY
jgi:hypothetical protein